jgi:molecular chaperone GrpE
VSHHHSHKDDPLKTANPDAAHAEGGPETASPGADESARQPEAPASETAQAEVGKKTPSCEENAKRLRAELDEAKQRAMRFQAELDNYRKRAARETEDRLRYANIALMRDLLPVLDNIQRAIEAAEKSTDGSGLLEGVKLVAQQLQGVLQRHHCVKIDALGAQFDPHLHHAIFQQPSETHPPNTVITVTQDGYQLHDRVVRHSQVIVSSSPTNKSEKPPLPPGDVSEKSPLPPGER